MGPTVAIGATASFTTILMGASAEGEVLRPQVNFRGKTKAALVPLKPENKECLQFASPKTHCSSVESLLNHDLALIPAFNIRN